MPGTDTKGHVITEYAAYFGMLKAYRSSPEWQKTIALRGTILKMCSTIEPVNLRHRLRRFWAEEAAKQGLDTQQLQTWS